MASLDQIGKKRKRQDQEEDGKKSSTVVPSRLLEAIIGKLAPIEDEDGNKFKVLSHKILDPARREIYARRFPEMTSGTVVSLICKQEENDDDEEEEEGGEDSKTKLVEHLAIVSRNEGEDISSTSEDAYEAKPFLTECKISYEEVSPTQLVEYKFKESPRWYLGMSTRLYLEAFRKSKFKSWKELILTTTCQKTLKSLLGLGPITRLYDRFALPTPPELKGKFETVDDNGKIVHIPHCVAGLRVWEPDSKSYEAITPHLDGAPSSDAAVDAMWSSILDQLRQAHGSDVINKLIKEGQTRFAAQKSPGKETAAKA